MKTKLAGSLLVFFLSLSFFLTGIIQPVHAQTTLTIPIASSSDIVENAINDTIYYPSQVSLSSSSGVSAIGQILSVGVYHIARTNLRFNTSSVPINAQITSVKLLLTIGGNNLDESITWSVLLFAGFLPTMTSFSMPPSTAHLEDTHLITSSSPVAGETIIFNVNPADVNRTSTYTQFIFSSSQDFYQIAPNHFETLSPCGIPGITGQPTSCVQNDFRPVLTIIYTTPVTPLPPGGGVTVGAGGDIAGFAVNVGLFFGFTGSAAQNVGGLILIFIFWIAMTMAIVVPMAKFRVEGSTIGMVEFGGSLFLLLMGIAFTWLPIWILVVLIIIGIGGMAFTVSDRVSRRGTG